MKIITKDAVYVQKADILFINNNNIAMPKELFYDAFNHDIVFISEQEHYEFVKYDKSYIDYFKNLTFIIDLMEIAKLNEKQIIKLGKETLDECNRLKEEYNYNEIYNNKRLKQKIKILDYKFGSIGYALQLCRGNIKINIPTEVLNNNTPQEKQKRFSLRRKK